MIEKNLLIHIKNKNLDYLNANESKLLNNNIICEYKRTIFMYCLKFNLLNYVEKQIESLEYPSHKDLFNYTILDYAIKHDVKYFNNLLEKFDYQTFEENKNWPHKFLAVSFNNQKVLEKLIKIKKDINIKNEKSFSLLNYSIIMKRTNISIYLLNKNADFEEFDHRGWNSLFFGYFYEDFDVIDHIRNLIGNIKFKKMILQKDIFGKTPKDYENKKNSYSNK